MPIDRFTKTQPTDRPEGPSRREFVDLGSRIEKMADQLRAILADIERPLWFAVSRSAAQSITNAVSTTLLWDRDDNSTSGGGLVDLATGIFTAPRAGLWLFFVSAEMDAMADQTRARVTIVSRIGATDQAVDRASQFVSSAGGLGTWTVLSPGPIMLAKGDAVRVDVLQNDAAPVNLLSADSWFRGVEIGRFR